MVMKVLERVLPTVVMLGGCLLTIGGFYIALIMLSKVEQAGISELNIFDIWGLILCIPMMIFGPFVSRVPGRYILYPKH